ncbi:MAG: PIN domain-containing protein [Planctomycetaceae bacterium]|jgi:predicted nucleic acid-binding protein|nr:PIN domain-containing protein [Planctomycetaceae bacterium]
MLQMNGRAFVDTNVFIYLYSGDEITKREIAQKAINKYECIISTQVLNEFSNTCIKKLYKKAEEVELAIDEITERCNILTLRTEDIKHALNIHKIFGYSYYDCLIIVSALNSKCDYLLTEDLANGQIIGNKLTIVNIFLKENIEKYLT